MKALTALLAGLLIGLGAMFAADRAGVIDLSSSDTTTTSSTTTSTTAATTSTTTAGVDPAVALWPPPGSTERFDAPEAVARDFAVDFLGFATPIVGSYQAGDPSSGEVPVQATNPGPTTQVLVRQLVQGQWWVTGAASDKIQVDAPQPGALATSPLEVRGAAHAFEGTVAVEIRADGAAAPVGRGFVTGGGDQMVPFQGSITFDEAAAKPAGYGAAVFFEESARDGEPAKATVIRIRF